MTIAAEEPVVLRVPDFLNPTQQLTMPLVEVTDSNANPYAARPNLHVRIFAQTSPPQSIKLLPALECLSRAHGQGLLLNVNTLVVPTSGNYGIAVATLAPYFGIKHIVAIVPNDIAPGKLSHLELLGVHCMKPNRARGETSSSLAIVQAKKPDHLLFDQYTDPGNQASFKKWLAPSMWYKTDHKLTVFCAAMGSCGTIRGCYEYFQELTRPVTVIGGVCDFNDDVPGARSERRLKQIGFDCSKAPFRLEGDISALASYSTSKLLCQSGLVAGPSSGLAHFALLRFLNRHEREGTLNQFRNDDGDVVCAFVCADDPRYYTDKYSTHLPDNVALSFMQLMEAPGDWSI